MTTEVSRLKRNEHLAYIPGVVWATFKFCVLVE